MTNKQKSEALMGAAMLAIIAPATLGFFAGCVAFVIYAPWVIKVPVACIGLSAALAIASWCYME